MSSVQDKMMEILATNYKMPEIPEPKPEPKPEKKVRCRHCKLKFYTQISRNQHAEAKHGKAAPT